MQREGGRPVPPGADGLGAWRRSTPRGIPAPTSTRSTTRSSGYRERFVKDWPGPRCPTTRDPVFPDGLAACRAWTPPRAAASSRTRSSSRSARRSSELFERLGAERRSLALHLREREGSRAVAAQVAPPRTVSVGGVIDYARCPKRFYWTAVRPLPRFCGTGRPDRHRGPPVDRAPCVRTRRSCSSSTTRPTSPRDELADGAGQGRTLCGRRSSPAGSRASSRCSPSAPSSCGWMGFAVGGPHRRGLRRRRRRARGRSSTGRPVADRPPTIRSPASSSTSTAWPASRSGASVPRTSRSRISTSPAARRSRTRWTIPTRCGRGSRTSLRSIGEGAFDPTPGRCATTATSCRSATPDGPGWRRDA